MQSKNALGNLKNRYKAVLKKCNLLNVFGSLALATMCASPFMTSEAFAADNPVGNTVIGMDATDGTLQNPPNQVSSYDSPILNNYGNIINGVSYGISSSNPSSPPINLLAGMFGYSAGDINYIFSNNGSITVSGTGNYVNGMYAYAIGDGSHHLTNNGSIEVSGASGVLGMEAKADGDGSHHLSNSGSIEVSGTGNYVHGMYAYANGDGSHHLSNSGSIDVDGTDSVRGMRASVDGNGNHHLINSGSIEVSGDSNIHGMYAYAYAIGDGSHHLTNSGSIDMDGTDGVHGMYAYAQNNGNHHLTNNGNIDVSGTDFVFGMYAFANGNGSHHFTNSGSIEVSGGDSVYGILAEGNGNRHLTNNGSIEVSGTGRFVHGMRAYGNGNHHLSNSGSIEASGTGLFVSGMSAFANGNGSHHLTNSGSIEVSGTDDVYGMNAYAFGSGNHTLTNSGSIKVSGTDNVYGMYVYGTNVNNGMHLLNNTGIITAKATAGSAYEAYGANSYAIGTWVTTLQDWTANNAVFGFANGVSVDLSKATIILHPKMVGNNFEFGVNYDFEHFIVSSGASVDMLLSDMGTFTTEVPFLQVVITGTSTANASVRLDANINDKTTPDSASTLGNLAVVQGQMGNIARNLLQAKYTEMYMNLVSDSGKSSISAGSDAEQNNWTAFMAPYGTYTNNSEYDFDGSQMGVTGGLSYAFSDDISAGVHFDFNDAKYNADFFAAESDSTSVAFGLHAMYDIMPQWYVSAQATGAISQTENDYSFTTGFATAYNDYDSQAIYLALNSGYMFEVAKGHTLTPQIGLSYLNIHMDSYDIEWGSSYSVYDMHYDSKSYSAFYADVALDWRSEWQFKNESTLSFMAELGLRQNLSGNDIDSDVQLFGTNFRTRVNADDTTFLAGTGLEVSKNNLSLSLEYQGEFGSKQQSHTGSFSLKYRF